MHILPLLLPLVILLLNYTTKSYVLRSVCFRCRQYKCHKRILVIDPPPIIDDPIIMLGFISIIAAAAVPVKLIIDTDAGFDVDDVGAVSIGNALQDAGEASRIFARCQREKAQIKNERN